ncbi:hypothetical protein AYI68_g7974 [Smittium mucronatum]|uniref:WD repeat-containing protein n=1 Tax=Smittium mucronatum TaxID=133383 RepID=A0A1R0GM78_9FUNG|nr:hypothetical protein AYI68_g7974 [Smittium mucronatum]
MHGREVRSVSWGPSYVFGSNEKELLVGHTQVDKLRNSKFGYRCNILASGGEEGNLIVSSHIEELLLSDSTSESIKPLRVKKIFSSPLVSSRLHTSAIRCLDWIPEVHCNFSNILSNEELLNQKTLKISSDDLNDSKIFKKTSSEKINYLISAGGSEEIFLWKIRVPSLFIPDLNPKSNSQGLHSGIFDESDISLVGECGVVAVCPTISPQRSHRVTSVKVFYFPIDAKYANVIKKYANKFEEIQGSKNEKKVHPGMCFMAAGYSDGSLRLYSVLIDRENNNQKRLLVEDHCKKILEGDLGIIGSSIGDDIPYVENLTSENFANTGHTGDDISFTNNTKKSEYSQSVNKLNGTRFEYIGSSPEKTRKRCILSVNCIILENPSFKSRSNPAMILLSGDTGGSIHVWDVTSVINQYYKKLSASFENEDNSENKTSFSSPYKKHSVQIIPNKNSENFLVELDFEMPICTLDLAHQSGVNEIDAKIVAINDDFMEYNFETFSKSQTDNGSLYSTLIASAGEDDSISLFMLTFLVQDLCQSKEITHSYYPSVTCKITGTKKIENAHSSSLQSICIIKTLECQNNMLSMEESLLSVSTDQAIKEWNFSIKMDANKTNHSDSKLSNTDKINNEKTSLTLENIKYDINLCRNEPFPESKDVLTMVSDPTCLALSSGSEFFDHRDVLLSVGGMGMEVWSYSK